MRDIADAQVDAETDANASLALARYVANVSGAIAAAHSVNAHLLEAHKAAKVMESAGLPSDVAPMLLEIADAAHPLAAQLGTLLGDDA